MSEPGTEINGAIAGCSSKLQGSQAVEEKLDVIFMGKKRF